MTVALGAGAFRAVFLGAGSHRVAFTYRPAGFALGLAVTAGAGLVALVMLARPRPVARLGPEHAASGGPRWWPLLAAAAIAAIVAASAVRFEPGGKVAVHPRWRTGLHTFTWGAGIEAIPSTRDALGR